MGAGRCVDVLYCMYCMYCVCILPDFFSSYYLCHSFIEAYNTPCTLSDSIYTSLSYFREGGKKNSYYFTISTPYHRDLAIYLNKSFMFNCGLECVRVHLVRQGSDGVDHVLIQLIN